MIAHAGQSPAQPLMPAGAMPASSAASMPPQGAQGPTPAPPVTIDDVMALLRNDRMRSFKIEVETDSLVEANQNAEKGKRIEFVTAVGHFMESMGPLVREMPALAPMVGSLLQFGVRGFKVGSELEDTIEKAIQQAGLQIQNPPPKSPAQPSPEDQLKLQGIQAKTQAEIQKAQIGVQQAQADAQGKAAIAQMQERMAVMEHQMRLQELALKAQQSQREHGHAMQLANQGQANDLQMMALKAQQAQASQMQPVSPQMPIDPSQGGMPDTQGMP